MGSFRRRTHLSISEVDPTSVIRNIDTYKVEIHKINVIGCRPIFNFFTYSESEKNNKTNEKKIMLLAPLLRKVAPYCTLGLINKN